MLRTTSLDNTYTFLSSMSSSLDKNSLQDSGRVMSEQIDTNDNNFFMKMSLMSEI